ncbi:MAG: hypothetical protein K8T90_06955, partial [Planctomycetes bacterium]|nr:hypothetical protein [Planctomycetota bacterium]
MAARRGRKSHAASAPDDVGPGSTTPPRAVRLHTFGRGELLDGITSDLPDNESATPSHEYETAWFVWELLR